MRAFEVLIGLCLVAYAATEVIEVNTDGNPVELKPQTTDGFKVTHYELHTCEKCKLVLRCKFQTYNCRKGRLYVHSGRKIVQHCPNELGYIEQNSFKGQMNVTFENDGIMERINCIVRSTKPYIDIPEPFIDSSEHGMEHRSKHPVTCRCGWANQYAGRILGGIEAKVNEYPFPALLVQEENHTPFCGASIITPYHILTAAHCTNEHKNDTFLVMVGGSDVRVMKDVHRVAKVHQHELFTPKNAYDIAIVELEKPLEFDEFYVGPVCMPSTQESHVDTYIKVMGWGYNKDKRKKGKPSPIMKKVDLRVVDPDICEVVYGIKTNPLTQICTYNDFKDACQGDTGGPLVRLNPATNMYEQVGIVSYGKKCGSTDPGVNTDVAAFLPWIQSIISDKGTLCFQKSE